MTALASHCCFLLNCKTDKKATENKQKRTPIILLPRKDQLSFWVLRVSLGSQKSELVSLRNGSAEQRTHIEKGLVHRLHPHSAPGAPGSCSPGPLHHLFAFFFLETFPGPKSSWAEAGSSVLSQALLLISVCTKLIDFLNKTTETPPPKHVSLPHSLCRTECSRAQQSCFN